jgi:hypothetical protein
MMCVTEERTTTEMQEEHRQWREEGSKAFTAELERLMAEKGVEDLEELHRRFLETDYAYIPIRGRHRGKPVPFEEFKLHATRMYGYLYMEVFSGLVDALGLTEEETRELIYVYAMGRPRPGL